MPKTSPRSRISFAVAAISSAADSEVRTTGTCPTELKNHACARPTGPGVVKYSDFARKMIWRGHMSGKKNESMTAWWLDATMAGPSAGILSMPSDHGRFHTRRAGPKKMCLNAQYHLLCIAILPSSENSRRE